MKVSDFKLCQTQFILVPILFWFVLFVSRSTLEFQNTIIYTFDYRQNQSQILWLMCFCSVHLHLVLIQILEHRCIQVFASEEISSRMFFYNRPYPPSHSLSSDFYTGRMSVLIRSGCWEEKKSGRQWPCSSSTRASAL
jgi:hypothetical protein